MQASRAIRRESDLALNMTIVFAVTAANGLLFIGLPLWLLPVSLHFAWLLLPLTLLTVTHWATIHEAIHGNLHPDRRRNDRLGRALGVMHGSPFHILRFGHLSHHALNSTEPERPEIYVPGRSPVWLVRIVFYARLLVGLYVAELASAVLCFLPRRWLAPVVRRIFYEGEPDGRAVCERSERQLLDPARLAETRLDAALVLMLLGAAFWLYGPLWPVLVAALVGRALVVSFMDNAPHYGGETYDPTQGFDMRAPRPIAGLILNSNLHGTHHRHPNAPWRALPEVFASDGGGFAGSYLTVPWRQLKGPIPAPERKPGRRAVAS